MADLNIAQALAHERAKKEVAEYMEKYVRPDVEFRKESNPKEVVAAGKVDTSLVPPIAYLGLAAAFTEGALKYGAFNWRISGAKWSTYHAACQRHLLKFMEGEACDSVSKVHHLDAAMACLAILRDAQLQNTLEDDRPPQVAQYGLVTAFDELESVSRHLSALYSCGKPRYTEQRRQMELPT